MFSNTKPLRLKLSLLHFYSTYIFLSCFKQQRPTRHFSWDMGPFRILAEVTRQLSNPLLSPIIGQYRISSRPGSSLPWIAGPKQTIILPELCIVKAVLAPLISTSAITRKLDRTENFEMSHTNLDLHPT